MAGTAGGNGGVLIHKINNFALLPYLLLACIGQIVTTFIGISDDSFINYALPYINICAQFIKIALLAIAFIGMLRMVWKGVMLFYVSLSLSVVTNFLMIFASAQPGTDMYPPLLAVCVVLVALEGIYYRKHRYMFY